MDTAAGVYGGYFRLEDFGTFDGAAGGGDACNEDLCAVLLEDLLDAAPVGNLEGGYGRPDGDRVKTQQPVTKYDWIFGR